MADRYQYLWKKLIENGLIEDKPPKTVDCACGAGKGFKLFKRLGVRKRLISIDIDPLCVSKVRAMGGNARVGNITKLKLEDNLAYMFICSETLEHLTWKEANKAAKEIRRVTIDNGLIVITVPLDKEDSLLNPLHKQFLDLDLLKKLFSDLRVVMVEQFRKNKQESGNLIVVFRQSK